MTDGFTSTYHLNQKIRNACIEFSYISIKHYKLVSVAFTNTDTNNYIRISGSVNIGFDDSSTVSVVIIFDTLLFSFTLIFGKQYMNSYDKKCIIQIQRSYFAFYGSLNF
jgi:hypothetical protein